MEEFLDYILVLLAQIAGGPGPKENNLVRFGLPAIMWTILLLLAWSRQRQQELPREKLLVWGFALGLARELFMFSHVSSQLIWGPASWGGLHLSEPLEHFLSMAAMVVVAAAFLRYILDDVTLSRRYLQVGLVTAGLAFLATWGWWYQHATAHPDSRFNQTLAGLISHLLIALFAAVAIAFLIKGRGWLRNVVSLAMGLLVLSGFLRLVNYTTARAYAHAICPICNSLHILTIPLLGYVYLREQAIEKQEAEEALAEYRNHLEDLVGERTTELSRANERLRDEITERRQAEMSIVQRNTELAAQNTIAATLSRSLDLETLLNTALDTVLAVLEMEAGCLYLLDPDSETLALRTLRGKTMGSEPSDCNSQLCSCFGVSQQAIASMKPVVVRVDGHPPGCTSAFVAAENLKSLVSTPLVSKERAVGALSLGSRRPEPLAETELEIVQAIGQQIGMAVENARLYREAGRMAEELALLHESSVFLTGTLDATTIYHQLAEQATKLLGCQLALVLGWDPERQIACGLFGHGLDLDVENICLELAESELLQSLISQRSSITIANGRDDARIPADWQARFGVEALLCIPLWAKDRPMGFLFLIDRQQPRHWQATSLAWAESFASQAAIALEKAYLYEQAERVATLEERQRIAAEMHDGLAQTLSYLTIKAYHASELLEEDQREAVMQQHEDIQKAAERATREVRRSIASLQASPQPRQTLRESLGELIKEFGLPDGPEITLNARLAEPLFLPSGHLEQVQRVVQEALQNARRHAHAGQVAVNLETANGHLVVTVEDNGRGFDARQPPRSGDHFGLSIMRARAARIGGQVQIESAPGQGTKVILTCPLVRDTARS
ncbi:MAG: GAF domain-containing protein [Anaerolineae bacterium]|jgi:signal transduction histidine kinase